MTFSIEIIMIPNITNSNGEITKTEVVDLYEIYNFLADDFFIWNLLRD
jgi:hypothetical protein